MRIYYYRNPHGMLEIFNVLTAVGTDGELEAVPEICVHCPVPFDGVTEIRVGTSVWISASCNIRDIGDAVTESLIVQLISRVV
jgi:hypothetical protein